MKGNFRIPSLCTVCFCHCVVTGYFEVIKLKQSRSRPGVVQRVPGKYISQISWQRYRMVVSFSALRTIRLYPQELHEVLISVKGSVDPRVIVRPERLCKWKIPMKPSGIEISRSGLDLNIYRWTIFSNTIWSFYYTYASCTACNPVAPPIILESLNLKKRKVYRNFKLLNICCYISGFSVVSLFFWSTVGQTLIYCGHCIEVWCVPSATCGSWLYQSQNRVLNIGVFVGLLFNSLCFAPCVCSVYSSNPRAMFAPVIVFVFVNLRFSSACQNDI